MKALSEYVGGAIALVFAFLAAAWIHDRLNGIPSWVQWPAAIWVFGAAALAVAFAVHLLLGDARLRQGENYASTKLQIVFWCGVYLVLALWPITVPIMLTIPIARRRIFN